jgi:hypothetical protein
LFVLSSRAFERDCADLREDQLWMQPKIQATQALEKLLDGKRRVYVVTLRPKARVWLLAVIANAKVSRGRLVGEPLAVPVSDVNVLLTRMRLSARAVSELKRPRVLSDPACEVLDRLCKTEALGPENDALELVEKSPKRAVFRARELAKQLGAVPEAIALLDQVAEACLPKSANHAADAFAAARALERKLKREPDLTRYLTFAQRGAIDSRDVVALVEWSKQDAKAKRAELETICIENVANGRTPSVELVQALLDVDRRLCQRVIAGWCARRPLDDVDIDVWLAAKDVLPELVQQNDTLRAVALKALSGGRNAEATLEVLAVSGLGAKLEGEEATKLAESAIRTASQDVTEESLQKLAQALASLRVTRPLSVLERSADDGEAEAAAWNRHLLDPAIVELLLSLGVPLRIPQGEARGYMFWLYRWADRDLGLDHLERVGAHPFFSEALIAAFLPNTQTTGKTARWIETALERQGCGRVFEALAERVSFLADFGTLGALEVLGDWLEALCQPAVFARAPLIRDAIERLDIARLLRNQLRAGILDEWGWSGLEAGLERIPKPESFLKGDFNGPFPYMTLWNKEGEDRIVVVGPEGVVLDRPFRHPNSDGGALRSFWYTNGDVLACSWGPQLGYWAVAGGETFAMDAYAFFPLAAPAGLITKTGHVFSGISREIPRGPALGNELWCDGSVYYAVAHQTELDANGINTEQKYKRVTLNAFDPVKGEVLPPRLPDWMKQFLRSPSDALIVEGEASSIIPVPEGAEQSPLGAKDGFGGFALVRSGGEVELHGIDGRRCPGLVNGNWVVGAMTFPERKGIYPIVQGGFDHGIALPDAMTPLVPARKHFGSDYWAGTPSVTLAYFYLLRPRDPKGSRALAGASDEQARALLASAKPPEIEPEEVTSAPKLQAVKVARTKKQAITPEMVRAVEARFPEITHPRLKAGVAGMANVALRLAPVVKRLQSHLAAAERKSESTLHNAGAKALARLFDHQMPWWIEQLGTQLGQQMLDVSHYLFESTEAGPVTPARSVFPWEALLHRIGEVLYRLLARGTPTTARAELRSVLETWARTELCNQAPRLRVARFELPLSSLLEGMDREHPDRLVSWENRYFLRWSGLAGDRATFRAIEAADDGVFRTPPGGRLQEEWPADARFQRTDIECAIALLDERGPTEVDPEIAERVAAGTGLGKSAATLLWTAAYDPWLASRELRSALGIDASSLDVAETELRSLRLREFYAYAMPDRVEQIYDPSLADRVTATYNHTFGARTPLPEKLLARMRADLADHTLPLERDVRTLMDPESAPVLTRDEVWVVRPFPALDAGKRSFDGYLPPGWPKAATMLEGDDNPDRDDFFQGYAIGRFARYIAWCALELPGGDPARAGAVRIAQLLRERLRNPDLLVLAAVVDLAGFDLTASQILQRRVGIDSETSLRGFDDVLSRFSGEKYLAQDGGASAEGRDSGDVVVTWPAEKKNGLFISFRPRALEDDARLLAFLDRLGVKADYERTGGAVACTPRFGELPVIAPASFGHFLTWRSDGFQRLVDELEAPAPEGRYVSDPRISAPDVVRAAGRRHDLDENSATLYLQRLALPRSDEVRIRRYNGWSEADLASAAKRIADRGLAPRCSPRLYGLGPDETPVFETLLPLRPFAELFRDANEP